MQVLLRVKIRGFNATFNNSLAISWRSVYWWRKPECSEKTTDLPQVNDKLTTLVVIGTDYIGSCKSN
jgi:hypothetical protein